MKYSTSQGFEEKSYNHQHNYLQPKTEASSSSSYPDKGEEGALKLCVSGLPSQLLLSCVVDTILILIPKANRLVKTKAIQRNIEREGKDPGIMVHLLRSYVRMCSI